MVSPRLAFRTLMRTPFVTLVTVLSLALGIGANAAISEVAAGAVTANKNGRVRFVGFVEDRGDVGITDTDLPCGRRSVHRRIGCERSGRRASPRHRSVSEANAGTMHNPMRY